MASIIPFPVETSLDPGLIRQIKVLCLATPEELKENPPSLELALAAEQHAYEYFTARFAAFADSGEKIIHFSVKP